MRRRCWGRGELEGEDARDSGSLDGSLDGPLGDEADARDPLWDASMNAGRLLRRTWRWTIGLDLGQGLALQPLRAGHILNPRLGLDPLLWAGLVVDFVVGLDPGLWLQLAWWWETGQAQRTLPAFCLAEDPASSASSSSCPSEWPKKLSGPLSASLATAPLTPFTLFPVGFCVGSISAVLLVQSASKNVPSPREPASSYKSFLYDSREGLRLRLPWLQPPSDGGDGRCWSEYRRASSRRSLPWRFQGVPLSGAELLGREELRTMTTEDPGPRSASSVAILSLW